MDGKLIDDGVGDFIGGQGYSPKVGVREISKDSRALATFSGVIPLNDDTLKYSGALIKMSCASIKERGKYSQQSYVLKVPM